MSKVEEVMIELDRRQEDGVDIREQKCPSGWTVIDVYHPHTTPWDSYGRQHQSEFGYVLREAGIPHITLTTNMERLHPIGSGPNGRVRFGDSTMAGTYKIAVPDGQVAAGDQAIAAHRQAVTDWLHNGGPMPDAIYNR